MRPLSIAAAQSVSIRGEVAANVEHHCRLAERAAAADAQIVVFPELSLTGYELDIASELAFQRDDERLRPLSEVASACKLVLVVGAPIRLDSGLHIGAFILEPEANGRIYTKRHLHGAENDLFTPGSLDPLVAIGDERAAFAICADTSHSEHADAAAKRSANLYLAGVFFDPDSYARSAERLAGYAAQHSMAIAMANAGGPATNFPAAGQSAIWSESGALVARMDGVGAGLVIASRSERGWNGEVVLL